MKKLFTILLLFFTTTTYGQSKYNEGDTLYLTSPFWGIGDAETEKDKARVVVIISMEKRLWVNYEGELMPLAKAICEWTMDEAVIKIKRKKK